MDQGAIAIGPTFLDKDLFGQHLNLSVSASEIITRTADKIFDPATNSLAVDMADPAGIEDAHKLHSEGSSSVALAVAAVVVARDASGARGLSGSYANQVARSFTGVHGDPFELVHRSRTRDCCRTSSATDVVGHGERGAPVGARRSSSADARLHRVGSDARRCCRASRASIRRRRRSSRPTCFRAPS